MEVMRPMPPMPRPPFYVWIFPGLLLCCAYGLLGLTGIEHPPGVMSRCVLMNPNLSRIWSVGHIEIGLSYFGVFLGMAYYLLRAAKADKTHLHDLGLGFAYLLGSFLLDFVCVRFFTPWVALLIGDAIVMTFTLIVSRQLWFQRLLGVFVPLVFVTCGFGHFMEGLSYWKLTYPVNVPWTMVTADIGFAILVNAARFPAFIRGQDIVSEINELKAETDAKQAFFRDVLLSVTEGKLRLCQDQQDLPKPLPQVGTPVALTKETLGITRHAAADAAHALHFPPERIDSLMTALGEAAMNAVVHGGGGETVIRAGGETLQAWVCDHGSGIQMAQLPRATLERGFSTKDSLGHGFWMMLHTADHVDLLTSPRGTTLVLTVNRQERTLPEVSLPIHFT
jgi:anti-sigma regulatory factor (Ser/Thr protein kinase)